jgi:prophage maintenance system killer protein
VNKRTAVWAALVSHCANHLELTATVDALEELTLGGAEGDLDKHDITRFFEKHQVKSSQASPHFS